MQANTLSLVLLLVGTTGALADDMKMPLSARMGTGTKLRARGYPDRCAVRRPVKGWAICDPVEDACRIQDPGSQSPDYRNGHRHFRRFPAWNGRQAR
jgi:hypothetical protein